MKKIFTIFLFVAISFAIRAASFTSVATGNWGTPATWSVVGVDADGIPDNNDDIIITSGKTVTQDLIAGNCKTLTINLGGTYSQNSKKINIYGNFTINGTLFGNGAILFKAVGTISASSIITNAGDWFFYSSYTIAAGTNISKGNYFVISGGATVTNLGSVLLNTGSITLTGNWTNGSGSSLLVGANFSGVGILNASAVPNTVTYYRNATSILTSNSYNNLSLTTSTAVTKVLSGPSALTVSGNLTIGANVVLNCNSITINLGGNWTNTANTTCTNMSTVTFNGSGTQTISRTATERFKNIALSGTGTVLLARDVTCTGDVSIATGTLDVSASNFNLLVAGNFSNAGGTLNARTGTVTFNGAVAQTVSGAATTTFYNLTSTNTSGGISVTGTIITSNILTVSSSSFGTGGTGAIILPATGPTTFARIAPLGVGASLVGTGWAIQSYIDGPTTGGWQYLGSPTAASTLADWDGDARFWMSGTGGNDGNTSPMFYSVRTVVAPSNLTYANVTTQGTALTPGKGFMVYMADNHNTPATLSSPLVFDTKGTPNQGTINRAILATGYNLVSNPYACPITYASVLASSSATLSPNFLIVNGNGTYSTNPNGGVIAISQGFLAYATGAGNMTFSESHKTIVANPNIVRTGIVENSLTIKSSNEINGLGGQAIVQINSDSHNGLDNDFDLPFLASPYEEATNIWTTDNDNKDLFVNSLNDNADNLDIPMSVISGAPGKQLLSFTGLNGFSSYSCASLENQATGEIVNLKVHDTYSFSAIAAGEKQDFVIHFERNGNCPLADQNINPSLDALTQVYINDGKILVQFGFEEVTDVTVTVFNTIGQEVSIPKNVSVGNETITLENPGAHGIYLVRIVKGNEIVTKKIFL